MKKLALAGVAIVALGVAGCGESYEPVQGGAGTNQVLVSDDGDLDAREISSACIYGVSHYQWVGSDHDEALVTCK